MTRTGGATHQLAVLIVLWVMFAIVHWALGVAAVAALIFVSGFLAAVSALNIVTAALSDPPAK